MRAALHHGAGAVAPLETDVARFRHDNGHSTTPITEIIQLAKGRKRTSLRMELLHHIQLGESAHFGFLRGYLVAALGTSLDENCEPLDGNYAIPEIATESLVSAWVECSRFMRECATDLVYLDDERNGHNFWLVRNRYEAFWDSAPGSGTRGAVHA